CHKILHILMFITSFGEQNITYKCCSNFLIHLSSTNLNFSFIKLPIIFRLLIILKFSNKKTSLKRFFYTTII
ncbi:MAG: hypothetical protein EKK63_18540, partial [Acinetobacter sp.]